MPRPPPLERGAGPNSGQDWRESVGWKILLPLSGEGLRGVARSGRKGRDSGPCISSRWGLWIFEVEGPPVSRPSPRPPKSELRSSRPREGRGEGAEAPPLRLALGAEETLFFFIALMGRFTASPYFFVPA
jgi:hypothetical protein